MQSTETLVFRLREEEGVVLVLVCGHGGCGGYCVTSLKALRLLSQTTYWAKAEVMAIWQSLKWGHWYIGLSYDTHKHACIHTPNEQFLPWTLVRYFLTKRNKNKPKNMMGLRRQIPWVCTAHSVFHAYTHGYRCTVTGLLTIRNDVFQLSGRF